MEEEKEEEKHDVCYITLVFVSKFISNFKKEVLP
jgi:hypothetical protein